MIKRFLFLLIIVLALLSNMGSSSEGKDADTYDKIDEHALATPKEFESSIETLATYLTESAKNDEEKARAIYRWVAENVDYDVRIYSRPATISSSPERGLEDVLREGVGVCSGYGSLFHALCEAAGLECVEISGYGKGYSYEVGATVQDRNHAWNAVKIDGKWHLVDSTWGAGYVDGNMRFVQRFDDHYFFARPEDFVQDHLPIDPKWQLLDTPLSQEEFERLPHTKLSFFRNGLEIISPKEGVIKAKADGPVEVVVSFTAPDDVVASVTLEKDGKKLDRAAFVQREDEVYRARARPLGPGDYVLWIYSKLADEPGAYDGSFSYAINVTSDVTSNATSNATSDVVFSSVGGIFPHTYGIFQKAGVRLFEPMARELEVGKPVTFRLVVPEAEDVAVINEKDWTHLAKEDGMFQGDVTPKKGKVRVSAKFQLDESYQGLLEYEAV